MSPYRMQKIEESIRGALSFLEYVNAKDTAKLSALVAENCSFKDIWEASPNCTTRDEILRYMGEVFRKSPDIRMTAKEAHNAGHYCTVQYTCAGLSPEPDRELECAGIFEIHDRLITKITLYCRR